MHQGDETLRMVGDTRGGTRTRKSQSSGDFESPASTDSATRALPKSSADGGSMAASSPYGIGGPRRCPRPGRPRISSMRRRT